MTKLLIAKNAKHCARGARGQGGGGGTLGLEIIENECKSA